MTKAKLIKRSEVVEREQARKAKPQKNNVQKKVNAVVEWIENRRVQREDPRKAFAALFTQPQPQ
ncbi:MAG: hypothetical protein ABI977_02000 [Acidobacteriota bacterium]